MNPSIKRLLGALLLIGTLGVSSVLAVRAKASTAPISLHAPSEVAAYACHLQNSTTGEALDG
ncbi:MAG: hypothetical protein AB8G18_18475 [Gammaproteobacteria bacterium]